MVDVLGSCAVEEGILLVDGEEWIFVRCLLLVVYVLFLTFVGLSQVASSFEKEGGGRGRFSQRAYSSSCRGVEGGIAPRR